MKTYEKPILEVVSFREEEALMVGDLDAQDDEFSLQGIIGYSLRANSQSL